MQAGHKSSFQAKAVLPDGNHVVLVCQADEKLCNFSSKLANAGGCDREHMVVTCTAAHLGYFPAQREGEYVWIFGSAGKRKYRILRHW